MPGVIVNEILCNGLQRKVTGSITEFHKMAPNMAKTKFILNQKLFTRTDRWRWLDAWSLKRKTDFEEASIRSMHTFYFRFLIFPNMVEKYYG